MYSGTTFILFLHFLISFYLYVVLTFCFLVYWVDWLISVLFYNRLKTSVFSLIFIDFSVSFRLLNKYCMKGKPEARFRKLSIGFTIKTALFASS